MTEDTAQGTSRRTFIKGVVAAGAVASSSAYLFRTTAVHGQPGGAGTVERLVTLNINGQDRRVDIMPQETLAMTLRYKLGLTGTKLGCDRAECGACTVLVDDVPHYSCSVLPVRRLHARLRDGRHRLSQNQSEPDARRARARRLGQPVPLSGLRQDSHGADARRRAAARLTPWQTNSSARTTSRRTLSPR